MAQTKKSNSNKKKSKNVNSRSTKNTKAQKSLFDINKRMDNKQIASLVGFFFALFMAMVVFIDAGGVWGALRNFFFGVFGLNAFFAPFFIAFISIVAAIGKDTRNYKIKTTESFVIFALIIAFLHIVNADVKLEYGEQIKAAYQVFKSYDGTGMRYGYGVFGALVGGIPLLLTASNKLAAGLFTVLIILALTMFFSGTTILKMIQSLRKPAEVVGEYAEEKLDNLKQTYQEVSEDINEKKAKKAERAEKRRKESKHEIDLDIPLDDEIYEDVGVDPIIPTGNDYDNLPPVDIDDVISLFSEQNETEQEEATPDINLKTGFGSRYEGDVKPLTEVEIDDTVVEIDTETGEIIEETPGDDMVDEINDVPDESPNEKLPEVIYELPSIELLDAPKRSSKAANGNDLREKGETIVKTLESFGVGTHIVEICQSPSVTRFELQPKPGVKISRITALADDIAMNLAASGVRIEAPIPNKNAVGIEVPNAEKAMVTLREILETDSFKNAKSKINVALGRNIQGESTCADLAKMPHLLVAGTTGSGKSVCLNTMIMSLLYNAKPDEVKLIMIDPKKVEFTVYKSIPHLLIPVVSDPRKAAGALSWAVAEMDKRYALFADNGVRNLQGYNNFALENNLPKMPQIVIIIDELSDLMMAASNEVEDSICRLAQKARAAGMHLIVATQRPSVDVITGLIKANIPSRIAFAVKSQIDSRTIIDNQGAEKLLGNGDMLYCPVGLSKPVRVQGCYVSDDEIERVIDFVKSQGEVKYDDSVMQEIEIKAAQNGGKKKGTMDVEMDSAPSNGFDDEMTPKAVEVVIESGMASTTLLQRKLKLGYARAARIVDELSEKGIIGPFEGAKPRKVLVTKEQWMEMQANSSMSVPKQLSVDDIAVVNPPTVDNTPDNDSAMPENHNYFGSAVNNDFED